MKTLRQAVQEVQRIGKEHGFTIVVVGGALTRLIGRKTTIKKIDIEKRIITLDRAENPGLTRDEDSKTIVDIDCIAFSDDEDPFTREIKHDFETLQKALHQLQQQQQPFPAISLEPVLYHPYFPKPNAMFQFVSSIESYHDHDFFFRLGGVKQDVKRSSLALWTYVLSSNEQIVTFHPLALQKRYEIRGFSPKPKDKEKIWGNSPFAQFVQEFTTKTKNVFEKDFSEWDEFAQQIQLSKQPSMKMKRNLWNAYWLTIGTYLAHGTGFIGKLLLPLGNTFFAGK